MACWQVIKAWLRVDAQVDSWMNDRREKKGTSSAQASDDQLIQITDISS
jgi:hypothetical protein